MDEHVPSRKRLHAMIEKQGLWLVLLTLAVLALAAALVRKGLFTWSDLGNLGEAAGG
jgi:hypothetical protein